MGISGLLPALKSIQQTRPLSDFTGKTVAVDAYAWLHRGVHACATELATNKPTTKYVRYIMERVRILRHEGVEPYLVFDGGPLPAKKETEVGRKAKREENLAKGRALHAQGKTAQAREAFVKCVDVTPQMAYQCIKALRAENVKYVVAPYEADAQMAFLERIGLVDAIVTEDSDLLVFGCRTVLYKLDAVQRTVICISRADFASVRSDGIILANWSDKQFRTMAILSGCDYLASIPGIGLKTACSLLRRWKTAEQVVRAVALEGKKTVPKGYLENFRLAEKCFLHQRVYDPRLEMLVHLTEVDPEEWNDVFDVHIGGDIEASLAKKLALGEVDPISLLPMEDINPSFTPQTHSKSLHFVKHEKKDKGKGKAVEKASDGILSFFGPNAKIPQLPKSPPRKPAVAETRMIVGKASGKRTLADAMDQDVLVKRHRTEQATSKFFSNSQPEPGPSRVRDEKENIPIISDEEGDDDSLVVNGHVDDSDVEEVLLAQETTVDQEDGYISPTLSRCQDLDDLSSPVRPSNRKSRSLDDFDFGADVVSSPPTATPRRVRSFAINRVLCEDTPTAACDLRKTLGVEDIDSEDSPLRARSGSATPPNPTPPDPTEEEQVDEDVEDVLNRERAERQAIVAQGWKNRYAFTNTRPALHRSTTNVTPAGRHRGPHPYMSTPSHSAPTGSRRSLLFVDTLKKTRKVWRVNHPHSSPFGGNSGGGDLEGSRPGEEEQNSNIQAKLAKFRCQ